jgi:hypothetical protein
MSHFLCSATKLADFTVSGMSLPRFASWSNAKKPSRWPMVVRKKSKIGVIRVSRLHVLGAIG